MERLGVDWMPEEVIDFQHLWSVRPVRIEQNPEELKVLTLLLESLDVKRIIEIGSLDGGSLWYWMQICPEAKILSIEPEPVNEKKWYTWQKFDNQLKVIKGKSQEKEVIEKAKEWMNGNNLDFLFIDGDHEVPMPDEDFNNYSHFMNRGIIVFHDIRHHLFPKYTEYWNRLKIKILRDTAWTVIEVLNRFKPEEDKFHCPGNGIFIKKEISASYLTKVRRV